MSPLALPNQQETSSVSHFVIIDKNIFVGLAVMSSTEVKQCMGCIDAYKGALQTPTEEVHAFYEKKHSQRLHKGKHVCSNCKIKAERALMVSAHLYFHVPISKIMFFRRI